MTDQVCCGPNGCESDLCRECCCRPSQPASCALWQLRWGWQSYSSCVVQVLKQELCAIGANASLNNHKLFHRLNLESAQIAPDKLQSMLVPCPSAAVLLLAAQDGCACAREWLQALAVTLLGKWDACPCVRLACQSLLARPRTHTQACLHAGSGSVHDGAESAAGADPAPDGGWLPAPGHRARAAPGTPQGAASLSAGDIVDLLSVHY